MERPAAGAKSPVPARQTPASAAIEQATASVRRKTLVKDFSGCAVGAKEDFRTRGGRALIPATAMSHKRPSNAKLRKVASGPADAVGMNAGSDANHTSGSITAVANRAKPPFIRQLASEYSTTSPITGPPKAVKLKWTGALCVSPMYQDCARGERARNRGELRHEVRREPDVGITRARHHDSGGELPRRCAGAGHRFSCCEREDEHRDRNRD